MFIHWLIISSASSVYVIWNRMKNYIELKIFILKEIDEGNRLEAEICFSQLLTFYDDLHCNIPWVMALISSLITIDVKQNRYLNDIKTI